MSTPDPAAPVVFNPGGANFEALESAPVDPDMATTEQILSRFATDNGLRYEPRSPAPNYPGCIFTSRTVFPFTYHHFTTTAGRYVDFGNFRPESRGGGPDDASTGFLSANPAPASWGYLAVQIDRHLPNLMLLSKRRVGSGATLPITPDASQVLPLEGDFDKYFTLYCPKEFEQDALYVFTPDLMALLIDEAAPFDVEIVDNWMFFYVPKAFDALDPAVYERLFTILTTVGGKLVDQTKAYDNPALEAAVATAPTPGFHWDPSIVPDKTLPPGDRLRQKSAIPSIVVALVVFAAIIVLISIFARYLVQ